MVGDGLSAINAMCRFWNQIHGTSYHERWQAADSWRCPVELEEFMIAVYCRIDALLAEVRAHPDLRRVRSRGPAPILDDAEVLTMEVVGEFLGLDQDAAIYRYFPSLDALVARTGWSAAALQAQLLELELAGDVARLPGGLFQRIASA